MRLIPAKKYVYAHGKSSRILADLNIHQMNVNDYMSPMKAYNTVNNDLYLNTWIGRESKYVLPGIGCVVEELIKMHNDIYQSLFGERPFDKNYIEYIPNIDYSYYYLDKVDDFLEQHNERKILISNGPVQSNQAENFDFNPVLQSVAGTFPNISFILTQKMGLKPLSNVYYTEDIIQANNFDLNEVSYLSLFCDTIIGRNSGPHVFSQVRDNWLNPNKRILSFTYTAVGSTFVLGDPGYMEKFWYGGSDLLGVYRSICSVVER